MAKFGPGDRVRINCPGDDHHGERCIVTSEYGYAKYFSDRWPWPLNVRFGWVYYTNIEVTPARGYEDDTDPWFATYRESELVPDDYDGNDAVAWSQCDWRPESVRDRHE